MMKRRRCSLIVSLIVLIALFTQPAVASDENPTGQLAPDVEGVATNAAYTLNVPVIASNYDATYRNPFGVIMYGNVDDAEGLQVVEEAGARWATTMFYWSAVQPNPGGALDWSHFDTKARNAQTAGVNLFVLFNSNPGWAAEYPGGPVYDIQNLTNIVTAMVERYDCDAIEDAPGSPCVRYWSFYAEPDNGDPGRARSGGKGLWGHNGAGYAQMLSAISPAIHGADPQAKVLIGGLAYDHFEPTGPFVRSFLSDTLAALNTNPGGAKSYIDAVAFHYYPVSVGVWPTLREKAQEIRDIMSQHGVGNLPLLSPEMGYWSSPKYGSSEAKQAYWLVQNYVRGLSMNMRLLSWYKVFDEPTDTAPDMTAGLLRVDGTPKPSYFAFRTMTRELAQTHYAGPFQAAGAEGYTFTTSARKPKTVVWTNGGRVRVVFPYTHVRVVTATGSAEYDIWDNQWQPGAPGDVDGGVPGQIELELYEEQPLLYVERK